MAKMFYTLEEAAEKLGVTEEEIKSLAGRGELQQFRDRDKLMFKRDQIDALAGDPKDSSATGGFITIEEDEDSIPLASDSSMGPGDSGGTDAISLAEEDIKDTDDAPADEKEDTSHRTGISVFDADEIDGDEADPMAQTQITGVAVDEEELALESVGSGSGLLDLTRESDDTSLGAELLDEIYPTAGATDASASVPGASRAGASVGGDTFDPAMLDLSDTADSGMANMPSASGLDHQIERIPSASGLENLTPSSGLEGAAAEPIGSGLSGVGSAHEPSPAMTYSSAAMVPAEVSDLGSNIFGLITLIVTTIFLGFGLTVVVSAIMRVPLPAVDAMATPGALYGMLGGGIAIAIIGLVLGVIMGKK